MNEPAIKESTKRALEFMDRAGDACLVLMTIFSAFVAGATVYLLTFTDQPAAIGIVREIPSWLVFLAMGCASISFTMHGLSDLLNRYRSAAFLKGVSLEKREIAVAYLMKATKISLTPSFFFFLGVFLAMGV